MDSKWIRKILFSELTILILFAIIAILIAIKYGIKDGENDDSSFIDILVDNMPELEGIDQPKIRNTSKKRVNRHEELCRDIFENIFQKPFPSCRPSWLKNPKTGRNLELDGFNPYIKTHMGKGLAFEYDGVQHTEFTPTFHRSREDFNYQKHKDELKNTLCRKKGILLLRIPPTIPKEMMRKYITDLLNYHDLYHGF
jgi:hypothetical protein